MQMAWPITYFMEINWKWFANPLTLISTFPMIPKVIIEIRGHWAEEAEGKEIMWL